MRRKEGSGTPAASVTAAIVNYNGLAYLDELLTSLAQQDFRDFDALLIDNGSSDGSLDHVRRLYPWVRVLDQGRNLGFAQAGNAAARHSSSEYLVLLNTDLRLHSDFLRRLVDAAREDHRVAAIASKMLLYDSPDRINGVGGCMNRIGYTWDRGMFEPDRGQYDQPSDVLFASAGAALFRREAFLRVGGFDERFFMYHEDVDLCWRLWILGYRVTTAPDARALHHFGGTTKSARSLSWREIVGERNSMRSMLKNYEWSNVLRAYRRLLLRRCGTRRKLAQLRSFLWNLLYLPETLRMRNRIQRSRKRRDVELADLIVESEDVPIRL